MIGFFRFRLNLVFHFVLVVSAMMSCDSVKTNVVQPDKYSFKLSRINDTLYHLQTIPQTDYQNAGWSVPYPVYQFEIADINNDGNVNALVGVIKKTRFDDKIDKRLFIFKDIDGTVRPLWLGSRLSKPLVRFEIVRINNENRLRSIEKEQNGDYLVAEYKWKKFGFEFTRYLTRHQNIPTALLSIKNT